MEIKRDYERKCIPLISIRKAFSKQHYAVKVTHGNGQLIVMSSVAMPEDRAALLTYLLEKSSGQRQEFQEERNTKIRSLLPNIINESFEVYTEIPVEIIQRKLAVENCKLDTIDLLLKIEEAIRAGEITAMISNNTIIKK